MRPLDLTRFALSAITRHRLRTGLLLLAMAIGVAAVILLTALGEGARRYVAGQFASLGTNLLIILPGRSETKGGQPPLLGETPRDLTLDDALALTRNRLVRRMAPLVVGAAAVSFGRRARELTILGSTAAFEAVRHLELERGRFLPAIDPARSLPVCVLGRKARDELFGPEPALGRWVRIGDRRFRVIGILAPTGQSLGADLDNVAIIPVASAQQLFNTASLFRILVEVSRREDMLRAKEAILDTIRARHEGEDDVTIITQDALLATFDQLFLTLTLAVGGIAGISLVVAGILIMNVTLVSVSQRTPEIGLLKALGATPGTIRAMFLTEAGILALVGAGIGLLVGQAGIQIGRGFYPDFPLAAPLWAVFAALGVAVSTSLLFALLPARRAGRLDPVQALAGREEARVNLRDGLWLVTGAVRAQPMRAALTAVGIAVGIAAVVLLTAIGEGLQRYVVSEFTQFGTNLIAITPGKTSTFGASVGIFGTVRPLSLDDSEALRRVPGVLGVVPVIQGNARVEAGRRSRRTEVLGVGPDAPLVWRIGVAVGRALPHDDPRSARSFAILGAKLRNELFGVANPLGESVRIGQSRFRVIGVMEPKGQVLGFDLDNAIYIPAARALELFNRVGLMEVDVLYAPGIPVERVEQDIRRRLIERHGREDFTIINQNQMLDVLGDILGVLTGAVAALGSISLLVGGVGILTVMTIAVTERTAEIGLLRALGGGSRQILLLFLGEAVLLASAGGLAGLAVGGILAWLLGMLVPVLPVHISTFYALLSLGVAAFIGMLAGVLPAWHASRLDPIEALRAE